MSSAASTSAPLAAGPVPLSRVWSRGRVIAEDLSGEDLNDVLELHADASAWWVLPRDPDDGAAELREVARALDLDDLTITDLLATDRRATFEAIGGARLVVTNYVRHDPATQTLTVLPISVIATDRALICLVADDVQFGRLLQQKAELLADGGVEVGLQLVITAVINTYEGAVQWLEDAADDLSGVLFAERPLNRGEQLQAFRLRAALTQLRRLTEPMRAVLAEMVEDPPPLKGKRPAGTRTVRRWGRIAGQHTRVADGADALREVLASVVDTSLSLADARRSAVMKTLAGWALILAVPTVITGFVGMNVAFPLDGTAAGFWVALLAMVVTASILFLLLRRRGWL